MTIFYHWTHCSSRSSHLWRTPLLAPAPVTMLLLPQQSCMDFNWASYYLTHPTREPFQEKTPPPPALARCFQEGWMVMVTQRFESLTSAVAHLLNHKLLTRYQCRRHILRFDLGIFISRNHRGYKHIQSWPMVFCLRTLQPAARGSAAEPLQAGPGAAPRTEPGCADQAAEPRRGYSTAHISHSSGFCPCSSLSVLCTPFGCTVNRGKASLTCTHSARSKKQLCHWN